MIIGASEDANRYSNRAQKMLVEHGYSVIPISRSTRSVMGEAAYRAVGEIPEARLPVDTVTVYVNPRNFDAICDEVFRLEPRRVIFNPGSEHAEARRMYLQAGIEVEYACTLVMLGLGEF